MGKYVSKDEICDEIVLVGTGLIIMLEDGKQCSCEGGKWLKLSI